MRVGGQSLSEIAKMLVVSRKTLLPNVREAIFEKVFELEVVSEASKLSKSD